jgi:bifunctional oligoribonuclease and PAP phosphatase NrnA
MNNSDQIYLKFKQATTIAIFGHTNIDGDCIGSMLWLGTILTQLWKKVSYHTPIIPATNYNFIPGIEHIQDSFDYNNYDLLVFLDFWSYHRIQKFTQDHEKYFDTAQLVIIDHHHGESPIHALTIKDIMVTSCAELVFESCQNRRPEQITADIATYFYLGLVTDSGNFFYDHESIRIHHNAMQLLQLGANKKFILDNLFYTNTLESVQFMSLVIERIHIEQDILFTRYSTEELEKYNINKEQADNWFSTAQSIKGPKLYVRLLHDHKNNHIRWSTRANGFATTNCHQLCHELFGGGGHHKAAGFTYPVTNDFMTSQQNILNSMYTNLYRFLD